MFCMSLNKAENRRSFKENEAAYLDRFALTAEQRRTVLERDWLGMLQGRRQYLLHHQDRLLRRPDVPGRGRHDVRRAQGDLRANDAGGRPQPRGQPLQGRRPRRGDQAWLKSSPASPCSHVPAIGVAMDRGMTGTPYWEPLFKGYGPAREWLAKLAPDVAIIVYNDHACAFSLEIIPTFLIGVARQFPIADEGFGPRPVPVGARPSRARLASGGVADPR